MKISWCGSLLVTSALLTACSSGGGGGGSANVSNLVTRTYDQVVGQTEKAAGNIQDLASSSLKNTAPLLARASFGADWDTNTPISNPLNWSQNISVQQYLLIQMMPDALNSDSASVNVFGRLKQGLGVFCALGVAAGMSGIAVDSAGYPADGTHTVTLTTAIQAQMKRQCDMDPQADPSEQIQLVISTSSGIYDKSFGISGFNQVYLVKVSDAQINIATGELHDDGVNESRTVIQWNRLTGVLKAQYNSEPGAGHHAAPNSGLYAYRLYFNETTDVAQIFAYEGPSDNQSNATIYTLVGKPQTGTGISLSFKNPNVSSGAAASACVNTQTGGLMNDGSFCSPGSTALTGHDLADSNTVTMINSFYSAHGLSNDWKTVTSTTTISWESNTMFTATIAP